MTDHNTIMSENFLLDRDTTQYCYLPIKYPSLEEFYLRQSIMFWVPGVIDFSHGYEEWENLDDNTKRFVSFILYFFAQSDGLIVENLIENFKRETSHIKEARFFYAIQEAIETIHNQTYSILIETFIKDKREREKGFDAIKHYPSIRILAEWMFAYMNHDNGTLMERIIAFACVEGIFFSSSFCSIYWLWKRSLLLPLTQANEMIAKDEALHTEFAGELYKILHKYEGHALPSTERAHDIIKAAVNAVSQFTRDALQVDLIGLTADEMIEYVKCCADKIAEMFELPKIYNAVNPFPWMNMIALANQTNFFERRNLNYTLQKYVPPEEQSLTLTDDF